MDFYSYYGIGLYIGLIFRRITRKSFNNDDSWVLPTGFILHVFLWEDIECDNLHAVSSALLLNSDSAAGLYAICSLLSSCLRDGMCSAVLYIKRMVLLEEGLSGIAVCRTNFV